MTFIALQGSGLHGAGHRTHIVAWRTVPMSILGLPRATDLALIKHKRVYFPKGTLPWPPSRRPTRKTDHAKFRSEP